jgi:hypothetical protein
MGSSQGLVVKELSECDLAMYHQAMVAVTGVLDPEVVAGVVTIADTYAGAVLDSLPEDDPEILRAGLVGAFVSFFVDALLATTSPG